MDANLKKQPGSQTPAENDVIRQFKEDIAAGKNWYTSLLKAIEGWRIAEEEVDGRSYKYLIAGEAFDWLLLAERLCIKVNNCLPEDEVAALLFHNKPPLESSPAEFKKLIGSRKYDQCLNYFYGVTVEEALVQTAEDEVRKERQLNVQSNEQSIEDEAYRRIYGKTRQDLLKQFRSENRYSQKQSISLAELKEFTYWLFKYRLCHNEKARIASDTKKAVRWLKNNTGSLSV